MDLADLIKLIGAWEERVETGKLCKRLNKNMLGVEYIPHHFKHNAADTPDIHLERIVAIREQALRCPIPAECEHNLHSL